MKINIIADKQTIDEINDNIFQDLKAKGLISETTAGFDTARKHPTQDLYSCTYVIGDISEYNESVLKYVNTTESVELDSSWDTEIT